MKTLSELTKEYRTLPSGDIYKKTIYGRDYYYHQFYHEGKRIIKIVKKDEYDDLLAKINRRKEIVRAIREIKLRNIELSKNGFDLTGYVMNKNNVVAKFEKGVLEYINESLAPLVIKRTHSMEKFLSLRTIDMSRTNARILKKVLNINVEEDYKTSLYAYALSVSDHYWFKPKHSKLKYIDVDFDNDALFETALKGEVNVYFNKAKLSPELTTTGSYEKGWRHIDNEWWLYKSGKDSEIFSELFSSKFAMLIGIKTVDYEYDGKYIKSKNFSPNTNFEPIAALADNNDQYENIFNILYSIDKKLAKDYLKLIFFDSVVNNIDRHNENMGLLRDPETGKIISLAPNFDNNLSLVARNETLNDDARNDGFINLFVDFLKKNKTAKELFKTIKFKDIDIKDIDNIIKKINIDVPNKEKISNAILKRYNYLKKI